MESRASAIIHYTIDEVFRLTTRHVPEWSEVVTEEGVVEDKDGVGTTFRTVTQDRGLRMTFQGVVTVSEPPNFSSVYLVGDQFEMAVKCKFTDFGEVRRSFREPRAPAKAASASSSSLLAA